MCHDRYKNGIQNNAYNGCNKDTYFQRYGRWFFVCFVNFTFFLNVQNVWRAQFQAETLLRIWYKPGTRTVHLWLAAALICGNLKQTLTPFAFEGDTVFKRVVSRPTSRWQCIWQQPIHLLFLFPELKLVLKVFPTWANSSMRTKDKYKNPWNALILRK